jgi:hypothetical protein
LLSPGVRTYIVAAESWLMAAVRLLVEGQQQHQLEIQQLKELSLAHTAKIGQAADGAAAVAALQAAAERNRTQLAGLSADFQHSALQQEQQVRVDRALDLKLVNSPATMASTPAELRDVVTSSLSAMSPEEVERLLAHVTLKVLPAPPTRGAGRPSPSARGEPSPAPARAVVIIHAEDRAAHRQLTTAARLLRARPDPPGGQAAKLGLVRPLTNKQRELMRFLVPKMEEARRQDAKYNTDFITMRLYVTPTTGPDRSTKVWDAARMMRDGAPPG